MKVFECNNPLPHEIDYMLELVLFKTAGCTKLPQLKHSRRNALLSADSRFLLLKSTPTGALAGFLMYQITNETVGILELHVSSEHKRKGHKEKLLSYLLGMIPHQNFVTYVYAFDESACMFYQANGFQILCKPGQFYKLIRCTKNSLNNRIA